MYRPYVLPNFTNDRRISSTKALLHHNAMHAFELRAIVQTVEIQSMTNAHGSWPKNFGQKCLAKHFWPLGAIRQLQYSR